jgi:metal-responsive CopG/Arc/MetJ family transcriptional regulator
MRLHITLSDDLVRDLDRRVGPRRRSAFITRAVRLALEDEARWELVESSLGSIEADGHEWDADPASWVHESRRADLRRVG